MVASRSPEFSFSELTFDSDDARIERAPFDFGLVEGLSMYAIDQYVFVSVATSTLVVMGNGRVAELTTR
jgi:predicted Holliday junction resolvase-like endonuclease